MRRIWSCCGVLLLLSQFAWAEEPAQGTSSGASSGSTGSGSTSSGSTSSGKATSGKATSGKAAPRKAPTRSSAPAEGQEGSASGEVRETVALEIVAKAPKPIPPVELDMLQLRLMLTDLKASFASEIDRALFREPF